MEIIHIQYSSHFQRALKRCGRDIKKYIAEREEIFKKNCFDARFKTHKLHGKLEGYWSFTLTHSHRVLFQFLTDNTVGFIDVDDHSIYQ